MGLQSCFARFMWTPCGMRCYLWWLCCWGKCCHPRGMAAMTQGIEDARDRIVANNEAVTQIGNARVFSEDEITQAMDRFAPRRVLGEGGYGKVYLGEIADEQKVAVKVMLPDNPQQDEQFSIEVMLLSSLRHKNLVKIIGCNNPLHVSKLVLVYEFVSNGTLSHHLYGEPALRAPLPWSLRIRIAVETAEALAYLHSGPCEFPIVHNDIKSDNILLDDTLRVKLADFGLCRLFPSQHGSQGTEGYQAPEYSGVQEPTYKTDVYSFGVVLFVLISGKLAVDPKRIADDGDMCDVYLVDMIQNKQVAEWVDPALGYATDGEIRRMIDTVVELAMRCLQTEGDKRPPMAEILSVLKGIIDEIIRIEKTEGIAMVIEDNDATSEQIDANDALSKSYMGLVKIEAKGVFANFLTSILRRR